MSPVTKNGRYASLKLRAEPSENDTDSVEPTVVVAIAAALSSVGAAIAENVADVYAAATGAGVDAGLSSPPQPVSRAGSARPERGSIGAPARIFRA